MTSQNKSFEANAAANIEKLKKIKALVLDCDGILTDCRIWMDSSGEWRRSFNIRDGYGIKQLISAGYVLCVITGSSSTDIRTRCQRLGIPYLYDGSEQKAAPFEDFLKRAGLKPEEVAYMGDDVIDLPPMERSGFTATVPEAHEDVVAVVDCVTRRSGGMGAVREICDLLLKHGAFGPVYPLPPAQPQ